MHINAYELKSTLINSNNASHIDCKSKQILIQNFKIWKNHAILVN